MRKKGKVKKQKMRTREKKEGKRYPSHTRGTHTNCLTHDAPYCILKKGKASDTRYRAC